MKESSTVILYKSNAYFLSIIWKYIPNVLYIPLLPLRSLVSVCISSSFVGDLSSLWQLISFYFWSSEIPLQMSIIIDSFQFILLDIYCPSCVYWFISFISFGKFSAFNLITWLDMLDFSMFSVLLISLYIYFSVHFL